MEETPKITVSSKNIEQLREYFEKRILAIPDLQRNFVWNANRMRDLADSIYKGYAIGTFAIWDAPLKSSDKFKHSDKVLWTYDRNNDRIHYVIDGQQRLSALATFLACCDNLKITNDYGKEIVSSNICFTTKKSKGDDLNFAYIKKEQPDNKNFFSLYEILSKDFSKSPKINYLKKNKPQIYKKIKDCNRRFSKYNFCFLYIKGDIDEDNLKNTFIRLNTRGLSLSAIDRAIALVTKFKLRDFVRDIKSELGPCKDVGDKPIHETIYLTQSGIARLNSKSTDTFFKQINDNKQKRENFKKSGWKLVRKAISGVGRFLRSQGVLSSEYLPSTLMIPVLAVFYYNLKNVRKINIYQLRMLKKWFWYSALSNRYSGKGYHSAVIEDCKSMKLLARNKKTKFENFNEKIDSVDLEKTAYFLGRSSMVSAFYCLLALQKPRQFLQTENEYINLENPTYLEREESHHIFPQSLMEKNKVAKRKYHSIINICFLPKLDNPTFYSDPPYRYLALESINKANLKKILKSHLIPRMVTRKTSDIKNQFNKFMEERKKMIIDEFESKAGFRMFE